MRRTYLRDFKPGDLLDDVYVISGKQLSTTSTGKYFIKAFIADRSTQVTARIWNASQELFDVLPDGGFIRLRGRLESYQGNLQIIIDDTRPVKDGECDLEDLIPHTTRNIDVMKSRVVELLQSISNRHLRALMQAYLDDAELMKKLEKSPAAQSFHHAYIGGLIEHTVNSMDVADAIVRFYPGLSRDILLAGIFLHDIAKTWELRFDCAFGYTDGGQLVGHIVKSAMWIEHKAAAAAQTLGEPIPQELIDVLQHIVISHHGLPEFGAVKTPATPEAIAVHYIENLDAKMMMSLSATRGENMPAGNQANWTEYMKAFGVRLYRPDVAPPEGDPEDAAAAAQPTQPTAMNMAIRNPLFEPAKSK
jgi:3'-5' exoribonuclease